MTGITSKGRRGYTVVPNWRWEDPNLDVFDRCVAGWLASHADSWRESYVSRNAIARAIGVSATRVTTSINRLVQFGVLTVEVVPDERGTTRWQIVFHHDVWEMGPGRHTTTPWSPHDRDPVATRPPPGHVVTTPRSPHDRVEEQREAQGEAQEKNNENKEEEAADSVVGINENKEEEAADSVVGIVTFEDFWSIYPKKDKGKGEARQVWDKLTHGDRRDALMGGIRHAKLILNDPGLYVLPAGAVWLRQRRWEDDEPRRPPVPEPTGMIARVQKRRAVAAAEAAAADRNQNQTEENQT